MKALLITLSVVATVVVGALIYGMTLDSAWQVEREVVISAPPAKVMNRIANLSDWPSWTAWTKEKYPEMVYQSSGPERGVGAVQEWNDGSMTGRMEVTAYEPGRLLAYDLNMDNGTYLSQAKLVAKPVEGGTRLTWTCWGEAGDSPVDKLMMQMFLPLMGADFETGLNNLKMQFAG